MSSGSTFNDMVIRALVLCIVTSFLAACMANAAAAIVSQTAKTTSKAAGTAARITIDGARAVSHTLTKSFRGDNEEEAPVK